MDIYSKYRTTFKQLNDLKSVDILTRKRIERAFTSDIEDEIVEKIMVLNVIDNIWKLLLLLGIGLFSRIYKDIMKKLASDQKLYLIIANGDYIYGTNYQFCHGFIGKDVEQMTQEKAIQAFGRIGRNKLQQTYTVRLRDDTLSKKYSLKNKIKSKLKI